MTNANDLLKNKDEYEYGFHDDIQPAFSTGRWLTEEIEI